MTKLRRRVMDAVITAEKGGVRDPVLLTNLESISGVFQTDALRAKDGVGCDGAFHSGVAS